jgi:hypothetical protein
MSLGNVDYECRSRSHREEARMTWMTPTELEAFHRELTAARRPYTRKQIFVWLRGIGLIP